MIDQDGYVHVLSRADDVMNVAGHRLSTSLLEQGEKIWTTIKEPGTDASFRSAHVSKTISHFKP